MSDHVILFYVKLFSQTLRFDYYVLESSGVLSLADSGCELDCFFRGIREIS
jgi:hypothetical protein